MGDSIADIIDGANEMLDVVPTLVFDATPFDEVAGATAALQELFDHTVEICHALAARADALLETGNLRHIRGEDADKWILAFTTLIDQVGVDIGASRRNLDDALELIGRVEAVGPSDGRWGEFRYSTDSDGDSSRSPGDGSGNVVRPSPGRDYSHWRISECSMLDVLNDANEALRQISVVPECEPTVEEIAKAATALEILIDLSTFAARRLANIVQDRAERLVLCFAGDGDLDAALREFRSLLHPPAHVAYTQRSGVDTAVELLAPLTVWRPKPWSDGGGLAADPNG